jgi:hypothetical protein
MRMQTADRIMLGVGWVVLVAVVAVTAQRTGTDLDQGHTERCAGLELQLRIAVSQAALLTLGPLTESAALVVDEQTQEIEQLGDQVADLCRPL